MRPRFPRKGYENKISTWAILATKIKRVRNDHGSGLEWVLSFLHRFLLNNFNAKLYRLGNISINSIEFRRLIVCCFLFLCYSEEKFFFFSSNIIYVGLYIGLAIFLWHSIGFRRIMVGFFNFEEFSYNFVSFFKKM